jgi:hypothetical protein
MLTFKQFKETVTESVLDQYQGMKLITTKHYNDQLIARNNDQSAIKHIFRNAVDHLKDNDYGDQSKFLVYSKKYNQAVAFSYQQDTSNRKDKNKHLVATTIFPVGDKYANPSTKLITVEGYSEEFINYVNTFIPEQSRNEYPLSEVMVEGVEFYFLHGNLHNLPFTEFLEID